MRILSAAVASVLVASKAASAFTCGCVSNERASKPNSMRQSVVVSSTPDALGDYLAKAHEEKLRAVKDVETKKNAEIEVSMNFCFWASGSLCACDTFLLVFFVLSRLSKRN